MGYILVNFYFVVVKFFFQELGCLQEKYIVDMIVFFLVQVFLVYWVIVYCFNQYSIIREIGSGNGYYS